MGHLRHLGSVGGDLGFYRVYLGHWGHIGFIDVFTVIIFIVVVVDVAVFIIITAPAADALIVRLTVAVPMKEAVLFTWTSVLLTRWLLFARWQQFSVYFTSILRFLLTGCPILRLLSSWY